MNITMVPTQVPNAVDDPKVCVDNVKCSIAQLDRQIRALQVARGWLASELSILEMKT